MDLHRTVGVLIAALACACGGDGETEPGEVVTVVVTPTAAATLTSADGNLSLDIPPGAVSEDVTIGVQLVGVDDVPGDASGAVNELVYELTPDGLTFDLPVTVTMTLDVDQLDGVTIDEWVRVRPMGMTSSTSAGVVEDLTVQGPDGPGSFVSVDRVANTVSVRGDLSHFSWVWARNSAEDVTISVDGGEVTAEVGDSWPLRIGLSNESDGALDLGLAFVDMTDCNTPVLDAHFGPMSTTDPNCPKSGHTWTTTPHDPTVPAGRGVWYGPSPLIECIKEGTATYTVAAMYAPIEASGNSYVEVVGTATCVQAERPGPRQCAVPIPQVAPSLKLQQALDVAAAGGDLAYCAQQIFLTDPNDTEHSAGGGNVQPPSGPTETIGRGSHRGSTSTNVFGANPYFACGPHADGLNLCAGSNPMPVGDYVVVTHFVAAPIPLADPTNYYQYGFVFDADGVAGNNYQPVPQFPKDFFQDTDRWYAAQYDPASGWSVVVTDASGGSPQTVASDARIIIRDTMIGLVVPASEFAVAEPDYRVTAFRHTGDFGVNAPFDWNGDVEPPVDLGLAPFSPAP